MDLEEASLIAGKGDHLAVVATTRADGTVQASLVNAGFTHHPVTGERVLAFVTYGRAKLANLRRRPHATAVFRAGWQWAAIEGTCDIIGPDDPFEGFASSALAELLREVFRAAGGTHSDWDEYDRVMAADRRGAVLLRPARIYSNRR